MSSIISAEDGLHPALAGKKGEPETRLRTRVKEDEAVAKSKRT
jgi:hypothetical protein